MIVETILPLQVRFLRVVTLKVGYNSFDVV